MDPKTALNDVFRKVGLSVHAWPPPDPMLKEVKRLLVSMDVDCVLDVGANQGQFASRLRASGYEGTVVSFEPNPALTAILNEASRADPLWYVVPCAIGEAEGMLTLNVPRGSELASALRPSAYGQDVFGDETDIVEEVEVPVHRMDGLYPEIRARYGCTRPFLKLDTQGYDIQALRGAEGIWPDLLGLVTEVSFKPLYDGMPDVGESIAAVRDAGFDVTGLFPVVQEPNGAMIEMDCVARRREPGPHA